MDRELLLELGCEEIPASWLPALTNQVGDVLAAQLRERRLAPETPVETYSTPRRLTVRIERIPERQTDVEELINGPAASAPEAAVAGFAAKHGIDPSVLEKVETPKGVYLAFRKKLRGRTAVDVLPDVLGGTLRAMTFPKLMHWDAMLEDGKGELLFGRPIRWMLYTYGGRVVPFTISRTPAAQTSQVQDVTTGAATYGHRFLTTSGRAGRSIKVRSFEEYRSRLLENFVVLERSERHNKIASQLDAKAQRLAGRVSRVVQGSGLLQEVPDLVEYPSVIGGTFAHEFLELPDEVLTTTLIHHQHYFPVEGEDGKLKNAFLAVINTEPDNERTIARNAERVVTARLRDARFFWEADRKATLESKVERLSTLLFHKKLGTYKDKVSRIETLARWIAKDGFGASDETANHAALAARLCKADLATDMVREFPELQGVMGGVYARAEGQPEEVWKAIYHHYLPIGVEEDAPPSAKQLGKAAASWAAVSLADKLDTVAGMFSVGERPTGSRDPFGLRRAAQGVVKILADVSALRLEPRRDPHAMLQEAMAQHNGSPQQLLDASGFLWERAQYLCDQRGIPPHKFSGLMSDGWSLFYVIREAVDAYTEIMDTETEQFKSLVSLFKRIRNITDKTMDDGRELLELRSQLVEPAEFALVDAMIERLPKFTEAAAARRYKEAIATIVSMAPVVNKFFDDVLVMADDPALRQARLVLLTRLNREVRQKIGDPVEIAGDLHKQA